MPSTPHSTGRAASPVGGSGVDPDGVGVGVPGGGVAMLPVAEVPPESGAGV